MNPVVLGKIRVGLAAALFLAAAPTFGGAQHFQPVEWLEARGIETSESGTISGGRIDILIERWSSDEEGENLRTALNEGPDTLLEALQKLRRRAGVLWFPGQRGALGARARTRRTQALLFAREITTPTGRQIIVATDEHLELGQLSGGRRPPHVRGVGCCCVAADRTARNAGRESLMRAVRVHEHQGLEFVGKLRVVGRKRDQRRQSGRPGQW